MGPSRWNRPLSGPAVRWLGAAGIVLALGSAAFVGYRLIGSAGRVPEVALEALTIQTMAGHVLGLVGDLESDRRGFELTRSNDYLVAIERDHDRAFAALRALREAVAGVPRLAALVDSAERSVGVWVDEFTLPGAARHPGTVGITMDRELLGAARGYLRAIDAAAGRDRREGERAIRSAEAGARGLWLIVSAVVAVALIGLAEAAYRWQARVRQAGREMDLLLNALPFSLLSLEGSGRIRHTTGHAPSLFGLTRGQLIGQRLADVVSGSDREEIEAGIAEALRGAQVEAEVLTQADDGEPHVLVMTLAPIEEDGERVGVSALVRDVTAERALRTQVLQAERLSSVGSLVAGVAHELNNPLSAIATYATVISRSSLAGDDRSALDTIAVEARRAAQIVRNLLDFSRQRAHQHEPTNVGSVIERTIALRRYELRSAKVELTVNTESDLPAVMADGQELQQVFLNLLVNAEHAVRGQPVRQILIQAQPVDGATVRVVVEDSGPGVPEDKLNVIFEPFYTTKPKGEGTGLGLSLSRGIVTEHHGALRAERAAGGGARFVVELPALPGVQAAAAPLPGRISVMRPALAALGANVLLVDDDPANRNSLCRLLQRLGYRVSAVSNGEEALQVLEREEFTCVLSDVHMPVLDGPALYEAIAARWPELTARIAFMSGGGLEDPSLQPLVEKGCPVLQKPFELTEVRALLERFSAGAPGQPAR